MYSVRIWTYKNADEKAHTLSRRSKNVKKRTKTYEKRILCKFTFRKIEIPVIQCSAFGAHLESILVAMVSSTNLNHNELAWRRVLRSREQSVSDGRIRQLRVPKLNINANSYIDLIYWTDTTISEPSLTYSVTTNEIKEMIDSKAFSEFKISELPCHT